MKKAELTPEEYYKKKSELDFKDIQAFITRGYKKLHAACYILLHIDNTPQAKQYFDWLIKNRKITTADIPEETFDDSKDPQKAVHIAFTSSGLKKLELPSHILSTFSREFLEGIASVNPATKKPDRSVLLGDTGNNDPKNWYWGNGQNEKTVHCILMLFAPDDQNLEALKKEIYYDQKGNCFKEVYLAKTHANKPGGRKEHFGFMDGISQPIIKGLSKSNQEDGRFNNDSEEVINAGEFILGYKNTYGHYSRSPYVEDPDGITGLDPLPAHKVKKDLGKNGTYLVFRQIEQHVENFWNFQYKNSKEAAVTPIEKAVKLAAKMIGRWPNGLPLVTHPAPGCPMMEEDLNDFKYSVLDKDGVNCPLGAHIRRTNPRDQAHAGRSPENSLEVSGKHRMLRRGRIYGELLDDKMDIETMIKKAQNFFESNNHGEQNRQTPIRGLHFICLVSNISRQFEFVQSVWANTSTFADLCNEVDQVIAPRPTNLQPQCNEFTTPQKIVRNRYKNVPEFTTVVGGGYFFLPGIKALKYIIR